MPLSEKQRKVDFLWDSLLDIYEIIASGSAVLPDTTKLQFYFIGCRFDASPFYFLYDTGEIISVERFDSIPKTKIIWDP